jgi:hypothetical protein
MRVLALTRPVATWNFSVEYRLLEGLVRVVTLPSDLRRALLLQATLSSQLVVWLMAPRETFLSPPVLAIAVAAVLVSLLVRVC